MFDIFKSKARDKNEAKALLASLYLMSMTDDKISEEERQFFKKVCTEKGFTQQEISEVVCNNSKLSQQVPTDRRRQETFFAELVAMGTVDGKLALPETEFLAKYARKMGLAETDEEVKALIESVEKQQQGA